MAFALPTKAIAAGYRLKAYDTIVSTSQEAMDLALAGETGPIWIVSDYQSGGRGRRGNVWHTPRGNLAASLLLTVDLAPAMLAQLGFVAGLALGRALDMSCGDATVVRPILDEARSGRDRFALKWPNDVVAEGAKLAGILLQTEQSKIGRVVVIGIGVNVAHAPEGVPYPVASLRGLGCETDAPTLFCALSEGWLDACRLWDEGRGFPAVRTAWLAQAAGLGGDVAVRTADGVTRGRFETIDEHGQLIVRVADGSARHISAGEVHFGVAGSARHEEIA